MHFGGQLFASKVIEFLDTIMLVINRLFPSRLPPKPKIETELEEIEEEAIRPKSSKIVE